MAFDFGLFEDVGFGEDFVDWLIDNQWADVGEHFGRLWDYYQNQRYEVKGLPGSVEKVNESGRNYILGQEYGLPLRIRPDVWGVADGAMELGIAIAGIFGGFYGVRAAVFLKDARQKTKAFREVVQGNEIFKRQHGQASEDFKLAHKGQSQETKKLVAEIKAG